LALAKKTESSFGAMPQGKKWPEGDNIALCRAWLRTSENAVKGTDQSVNEYWDSVHESFTKDSWSERTRKAARNRWSNIQHDVMKFHGMFCAASRNQASGANDGDVIANVATLYQRVGRVFDFLHCWHVLKVSSNVSSLTAPCKRGHNTVAADTSSTISHDERGVGQKREIIGGI
jgi:hypothetical protein